MTGVLRPRRTRLSIAVVAASLVVLTPAAQEQTPPQSASASVALAQGEVIGAMTDLLRSGASGPIPVKARSPLASKYDGPDAALLQLQAETIALALEAFGAAPVQSRAAAPSK